jgi:hypothetical protein
VGERVNDLSSKFSPFYTTVINVVFWTISLFPAVLTIWKVEGHADYENEPSIPTDKDDGLPDNTMEGINAVEKRVPETTV